jgi:hypothetical protein
MPFQTLHFAADVVSEWVGDLDVVSGKNDLHVFAPCG